MPVLETAAIDKRYAGVDALTDVSLGIDEGEALGLIGPNGAGKSTLIDILSGFADPTAGEVRLRGQEITARPAHLRVRDGLGRTFQIVQVFAGMTALESIMVAAYVRHKATRAARSAALDALRFVGLGDEHGLPVEQLSLAQQRLLELARVLTLEPSVVLLDEPMSGLTLEERRRAVDTVRDLGGQGVSVLIVEHDMAVIAELCDRVCVLDHGRVIATGTPEEVARDETVLTAYLGTRHRVDPTAAGLL
jgi:branched-chain amino acid transport system ATP-binding protein